MEIAIKLLYDRYNITTDIASKIAERVWNELGSKDIQDVLKIGKLVKPEELDSDINWVIEAYKKYCVKEGQ
jgi:hypothetical protein